MEKDYDIIVLGGGAGGVPAAIRAAQLGGKVAIIESRDFGGQCMNRGCIPFGHMMVASNIVGSLSLGKDMGLTFQEIPIDYPTLQKRQNELIAFMRQGVTSTLKKNKVEIIEGKGKIVGKGKVIVNSTTLSYKNIILAAGAQWQKPTFPGADLEEIVNTDSLLTADKLPKRVLLFGPSPWFIEIAQFLHRFGSQVILATPEETILSGESKAIITRLRKVLKNEGVDIKVQAEILAAMKKKNGLYVDLNAKDVRETVVVDRVITIER
ncbi:MAG: NAD(P)/FAD-dependent oxidoreductase, partial [Deltaproteobacteria bacterium]